MTVSQILSVKVPASDHRYHGDSLRLAAFQQTVDAGETGVCLVLVERADAAPIQVVVNAAAREASIVLPVPMETRPFSFGTAFLFPEEICLVTEQTPEEIVSPARAAFPEVNLVIVTLERETACIKAYDYGTETNQPALLERSTEAAAAAAMVLHQDLENGTMESTIGQPGGILEIGMRKEHGKVTGLSAGGPVEMQK